MVILITGASHTGKTVIENHQNLIAEGCYIPSDWKRDFDDEYQKEIQYLCLVMTKEYIETYFPDIRKYANVVESRFDDSDCTIQSLIDDNEHYLEMCQRYGNRYILIDQEYRVDIDL